MKASKKVLRQMTKTYEPKKPFAGGGYGKVGKTVLAKRMRGKKKP